MNPVGAGFGRVVENPSGSLPEFRGKTVLHQGELLQSVHRGLLFVGDARVQAAAGVLSIQDDPVGISRRSVDVNVIPAADCGARREFGEVQRIPDRAQTRHIQRKRVDVLGCNHDIVLGILGLEQRSIRGNGNRCGGRADRQDQIHAYSRILLKQ